MLSNHSPKGSDIQCSRIKRPQSRSKLSLECVEFNQNWWLKKRRVFFRVQIVRSTILALFMQKNVDFDCGCAQSKIIWETAIFSYEISIHKFDGNVIARVKSYASNIQGISRFVSRCLCTTFWAALFSFDYCTSAPVTMDTMDRPNWFSIYDVNTFPKCFSKWFISWTRNFVEANRNHFWWWTWSSASTDETVSRHFLDIILFHCERRQRILLQVYKIHI